MLCVVRGGHDILYVIVNGAIHGALYVCNVYTSFILYMMVTVQLIYYMCYTRCN